MKGARSIRPYPRRLFKVAKTTPLCVMLFFSVVLLVFFCGICLTSGNHRYSTEAKEIVATNEWTLLGENDTIPAGLHVRMDMTTGEKWAKLIDDNDNDNGAKDGKTDSVGVAEVTLGADGSVSTALSASPNEQQTTDHEDSAAADPKTAAQEEEGTEPKYDYTMMHRVLSSLPPEEKERMGGLPELPGGESSLTSRKIAPEQRAAFEERMRQIWDQRQEELKRIQEELLADLPEVLKERIKVLESYLADPVGHVQRHLIESDVTDETADASSQSKTEQKEGGGPAIDIISVLEDLEYLLSDLDMARDFHTLGGWPLLVSLLSDTVHFQSDGTSTANNGTALIENLETIREKVHEIQASAAWALGTAVKNIPEFHLWSLEDLSSALEERQSGLLLSGSTKEQPVTALTLITDSLRTDGFTPKEISKRQKFLYALGSILRGNRLAQRHFLDVGGPDVLGKMVVQFSTQLEELEVGENGSTPNKQEAKLTSKVLALADDVISDVMLHPAGDDPQTDAAILNAFTTETWCNSAVALVRGGVDNGLMTMGEVALRTVRSMVEHCNDSWDTEKSKNVIVQVREDILKSAGESMDPEHREELVDMANSVLDRLDQSSR